MTTALRPPNKGPGTDSFFIGRATQPGAEPVRGARSGAAILRGLPGRADRERPGAYRARLRPALAGLSWQDTCTLLAFLLCDLARLERRFAAWQAMEARHARAVLRALPRAEKGGLPCSPAL